MKKFLKFVWREFRRWLREPRVIWRSEATELHITIEIRRWLPLVAFVVLLIWYIAAPSPVVLMSAVAFLGILLSAFLWARMIALGTHGRRRLLFAAMQVGDELEEQISLDNKTSLPIIWAEFVDRSNIPGYTVSSARASDPQSHIEWRAHTVCTRRGVFSLGPWELCLGEPFGWLVVRQMYLQREEILVYPPLAELPEQVLPHHGALGDHRPLNQPLRAETIASTTVRPYVAGDPLRHIHWRSTARHTEPFVKVFTPEAASNIWLVPDFDAADHVGQGEKSSEEIMVTVVASLAARLLQQNLAVGMFTTADQQCVVLPRQGQIHLWNILQALAPLNAVTGNSLETVLTNARTLVSGNDLLVLVTPSLRSDWIAALRRISRSRGSSGRAEVILLDPASFGAEETRGAEEFMAFLLEQGIPTHLLRREDVQLISGFYGEISRWEFSVLGTGRVITRRAPRKAAAVMAASNMAEALSQSTLSKTARPGE